MKKSQILKSIKKFCDECPLKCNEECRLFKLKNGEDPDPRKKRVPSQNQLEALKKSYKRRGMTKEQHEAEEVGI